MALGHNLDDMAQSILMNLQKGEIDRSVRLAPHTNSQIEGLVPRIVPLRWVPEQEIHAHALHAGLPIHHGECPHAPGAMRQQSRSVVAMLEELTPGARHGLLHSLDQIRDLHLSLRRQRQMCIRDSDWAMSSRLCPRAMTSAPTFSARAFSP